MWSFVWPTTRQRGSASWPPIWLRATSPSSWRSQPHRRQRHKPSVPIVFFTGVDPVANGFVSSLNHPGGNATGIFTLGPTLGAKRLELLHEIAPTADVVAVLISSSIPAAAGLAELPDAAVSLGVRTITQIADSREDFAGAFEAMARDNCRALYVPGDAVFNNNAATVVALAAKYRMPAIYPFREYVAAGGLASYGPNFSEGYRFIGTYAGRIARRAGC